jgi:peptide/nickel transport system substrate-binding protein
MRHVWSARTGVMLALIILVAALGVSMTACGTASTDRGASASASASGAGTTDTALFGPLAGGEASGDIDQLTVGLPTGEPGAINPWTAAFFGVNAGLIDLNLCDLLVRTAPDGTFTPALASKWEYVDDTTLVFTLREDVKFWDGKPLTSADVVYSLKMMSDPNMSQGWLFDSVKSITADGPYGVTVKFTQPDELFFQELATFAAGIIEKAWAEKVGVDKIGTPEIGVMASGPYMFKSWTPGQEIVLERNPDYWDENFMGHAATVTLKFLPDSTALAQALDSGEVDAAWGVPSAVVPRLQDSSAGKLYFGPSSLMASTNVMRPDGPLADIDLRKALMISMDREALAKTVFNGSGKANYTLLVPYVWYPETQSEWESAYQPFTSDFAYDLEAAKKLVADSQYDGEPITVMIPAGDATLSAMAQYMQAQGKLAGLNVVIKPLQPIPFGNALQSKDARKGIDLMLAVNWMAARDPLEVQGFLLLETPWNYAEYYDPQVMELLDTARHTLDVNERTKLLIEAQTIYEPVQANVSLVNLDEVSYLKSGLAGMSTSWYYFSIPALTLIGSAQ